MKVGKTPTRQDAHFNGIFYGATGVGKTVLIGSSQLCEATSPLLIIDMDGGLLSLAELDIDVVRPKNFVEMQDVYDFLRNDNEPENGGYRSVAVDTLTEEQRTISMGGILGEIDSDMQYQELGSTVVPQQRDWQKSAIQMRRFIRAFRDLSYIADESRRLHVFMTAQERVDEKTSNGGPSLPGVLLSEAGGYVDVLGRMVIRRRQTEDGKTVEERFMFAKEVTNSEGIRWLAKNRLGRLKGGIRNPTMDSLIAAWTGE